tara:strand:- start:830 stop:1294 length:465 start_codon:yes stop_codon:yes gene_type:complete
VIRMPERMTKEEAKIEQAIRAARIAKQKLLEETRNAFALEDDAEVVKVKRPKAEKVTTKVDNQKEEGYGLAGKEDEYKIKKAVDPKEDITLRTQLSTVKGLDSKVALKMLEGEISKLTTKQLEALSMAIKEIKAMNPSELHTKMAIIEGLGFTK